MLKKRYFALALLLLVTGLTLMASAALSPGTIAPDFNLPTTAGAKLTLSQFKGQVVILAFWKSD
jgi:cytochrome oxidase Cu insertion factor (SCO1/SenC/PrrC family)